MDIDLTALWFEQQKMIENNEITRSQFLESVLKQIEYEIQKIQTDNNFTILSDEKINMAYKALKLKNIGKNHNSLKTTFFIILYISHSQYDLYAKITTD